MITHAEYPIGYVEEERQTPGIVATSDRQTPLVWAVYVHKLDPSDCQGVIDAFGEQYCGLYIYMSALWAVYVT